MDKNENFIVTLGAVHSNPDIRDYKIAKKSLQTEFPAEFELEMPPVKNQGSVGSCVAHSIALVAEYFNKIQHNIDNEISVGYIYGNRVPPLGSGAGMVTRYAISNFCADGAPFVSDFPLHCEVPDIIAAVEEKKDQLHNTARQFRFTSYVKVVKEEEIKTALINGSPVIVAVDWQKDMKVKDGKFNSSWQEKDGGHAMVICGWDKDGWIIQNSWGVFWGNGGVATWPYDYPVRELYAIIDTETTPLNIKKPFAAKTQFGKWCVRIANKVYCFFYKIGYKIKN